MLKSDYKLILIKQGKLNLKQYNFSSFHIFIVFLTTFSVLVSLLFIFSDNLIAWIGNKEIEKHNNNNQILVKDIEKNNNQIDELLIQLDEIKKQDDVLRRLVKLPPIHEDIRKMGYGGAHEKSQTNDYNYLLPDNEINPKIINNKINHLQRLINLELLSYKELTAKVEKNINKILAYPAIYPLKYGNERLSSDYGYRKDPFSQKYKFHEGHDFSISIGASVHTTANGRVVKSKYWGSFGNYIEIDHGNGYITAYGHLSTRNVKKGDKVFRGQKIGKTGNTGRSTAPHLHYEVQYHNKAIDPNQFYFDILFN